ncbi:Hypothetical predicted protein, partial [Paramuricea clavata]
MGKCDCEVQTEKKFSVETFFVVKGMTGCLVSWKGSQTLGLVQVVQSVEQPRKDKVESLVESYSDLFEGLGKLKGFQVCLHVENNVQPIAQPPQRVPFHVQEKLEEQLLNDEKLGVIEKTEGPTPWVSPVVVVPKKDSKHRISPDPAKVTAIKEFATPKDASEVRSLLGMTNFCCRFIKNYATLIQPLRELTKKDLPFVWTGKQERALEKLCDALTNASENAYFDSTKTTEVFTD